MLSVYDEYKSHGVEEYYKKFSSSYYNPHEQKIINILQNTITNHISNCKNILDFACGEGLISRYVKHNFPFVKIKGCDPYFKNNYTHYNFSFDDVICGKLGDTFDVVICCYAYHLLSLSKRYDFLTMLSQITTKFIIITPNKKIEINHELWNIVEQKRIDKITIIVLQTKKFE